MPVVVIGADSDVGRDVVKALVGREGEVRAFISDPSAADSLRGMGVKVAIGDVSDASHIAGAALRAFAAIVIGTSASDERERSFAASPEAVHRAWAEGLKEASVRRVIWVGAGSEPPGPLQAAAAEVAGVDSDKQSRAEVIAEVVRLDDAATLG